LDETTLIRQRCVAGRQIQEIGVGGSIVDGMRPGIREQSLETVGEAMAVLNLERVIAGIRIVPHHIKLARELRIRRVVKVLPHHFRPAHSIAYETAHRRRSSVLPQKEGRSLMSGVAGKEVAGRNRKNHLEVE